LFFTHWMLLFIIIPNIKLDKRLSVKLFYDVGGLIMRIVFPYVNQWPKYDL
jgi:hypothetical protein